MSFHAGFRRISVNCRILRDTNAGIEPVRGDAPSRKKLTQLELGGSWISVKCQRPPRDSSRLAAPMSVLLRITVRIQSPRVLRAPKRELR
jgi:hypothetical protein